MPSPSALFRYDPVLWCAGIGIETDAYLDDSSSVGLIGEGIALGVYLLQGMLCRVVQLQLEHIDGVGHPDHHEPREPTAEAGDHRERCRGRRDLLHAHGRRRGAAPTVHREERHLRQYRRIIRNVPNPRITYKMFCFCLHYLHWPVNRCIAAVYAV